VARWSAGTGRVDLPREGRATDTHSRVLALGRGQLSSLKLVFGHRQNRMIWVGLANQLDIPIQSSFGRGIGERPHSPRTRIPHASGWAMSVDGDGWATVSLHSDPVRMLACWDMDGIRSVS